MKLFIKHPAWLLANILLLTGCTATLTATEIETFEPRVFDDGTKTFRYTLEEQGRPKTRTYIELTDQRVEDLNQKNTAMETEDKDQQRRDQRFLQLLDQKLETTGFCRDGYIELESELGARNSWLRGECRDSATAADRQRFGETVQQ